MQIITMHALNTLCMQIMEKNKKNVVKLSMHWEFRSNLDDVKMTKYCLLLMSVLGVYLHSPNNYYNYNLSFADVTISISFGLTIRNKLVYVWADDKVREFPREKFYEWNNVNLFW